MGLITTVPLEKTFLRVFNKPKKVRLSKQVIEVNYAHLSPFKNGGHLFFQTESSIYAWFTREPAGNGVSVPEGYLLYRFFKNRGDAIVLLPRDGVLNAVVIGGGELRAQATLQSATADLDETVDLLRREYALPSAEVVRLEGSARFAPKGADLFAFADFELNWSTLLEQGVALVKVPLIAALVIVAGFTMYRSHQLESVAQEKKQRLERLKRENAPLQETLDQVRDRGAYWRGFIAKEQSYPELYRFLAQLTRVVQRHGGYLNTVEYADNRVTIWAGLKSSEADIIKDLLGTGLFSEVKILSSAKEQSKPEFNLYNLSLTLRQSPGVQS